MKEKIGFWDLSIWIKLAAIGGLIYFISLVLGFIIGFVEGFSAAI